MKLRHSSTGTCTALLIRNTADSISVVVMHSTCKITNTEHTLVQGTHSTALSYPLPCLDTQISHFCIHVAEFFFKRWHIHVCQMSLIPVGKVMQIFYSAVVSTHYMLCCTVHCNVILQHKPTKCTGPKLIFAFLIFFVFYMFRTKLFIFRKTAVYTVMVWYVVHAAVYAV
jgi:hypothetical protein